MHFFLTLRLAVCMYFTLRATSLNIHSVTYKNKMLTNCSKFCFVVVCKIIITGSHCAYRQKLSVSPVFLGIVSLSLSLSCYFYLFFFFALSEKFIPSSVFLWNYSISCLGFLLYFMSRTWLPLSRVCWWWLGGVGGGWMVVVGENLQ